VSVTNQIKKYLHALLFIAFAVVIISAIGYLINTIPERTISIGERVETYTEFVQTGENLLREHYCDAPAGCSWLRYYIPSDCAYAKFDYTQATALSSYSLRVYNGIDITYTIEPGTIFILNHTGVSYDIALGGYDRVKIYCVYGYYETITTTIADVQISSKELMSYVYFAFTIVIVLAGIRKFLPQF
jgi:hypothetical protein